MKAQIDITDIHFSDNNWFYKLLRISCWSLERGDSTRSVGLAVCLVSLFTCLIFV